MNSSIIINPSSLDWNLTTLHTVTGYSVVMRTFLAFDIPQETTAYVQHLQDFLRAHGVRGKWIRPGAFHLTVVFLDEQPQGALDQLIPEVETVCNAHQPIALHIDDVDTFGRPPRVLFLDFQSKPPNAFPAFVRQTQEAVIRAGIGLADKITKREPRAHLTLTRFRHKGEASILAKLRSKTDHGWRWTVELPEPPRNNRTINLSELILYRSILQPPGARYEPLHRFILRGQA